MTEIARAGYHHLWWENRIRLVMGSLFVFVASNQVTSLEITLPPMFSTDQDQPDKPQLITNSQLGSVPLYGMDDHLVACEASMDSLHITSESDIFENVVYSCIVVKGRLRTTIDFRGGIGASNWMLKLIREGYLTKHWRSRGIRIFTYLDEDAGADSDFFEA